MDQWKVVLHNHLPAYISFERYLGNMERLRQNCSSPNANGAPREAALLPGLVVCGRCGTRLQVSYSNSRGVPVPGKPVTLVGISSHLARNQPAME